MALAHQPLLRLPRHSPRTLCLNPPQACTATWPLRRPRWCPLLAGVQLRGWQEVAAGPEQGWELLPYYRRWLGLGLLLVQATLLVLPLWVLGVVLL